MRTIQKFTIKDICINITVKTIVRDLLTVTFKCVTYPIPRILAKMGICT